MIADQPEGTYNQQLARMVAFKAIVVEAQRMPIEMKLLFKDMNERNYYHKKTTMAGFVDIYIGLLEKMKAYTAQKEKIVMEIELWQRVKRRVEASSSATMNFMRAEMEEHLTQVSRYLHQLLTNIEKVIKRMKLQEAERQAAEEAERRVA